MIDHKGSHGAASVRKLIQALAILVFLLGSTGVAWQFHDQAYDDLPSFYWATHLAFESNASAYQPGYFHEIGLSLGRKIYPFLYPPPSLLLFSPFLLGDYEPVKIIFTLCNLVLWWWLLFVICQLHRFHTSGLRSVYARILIPLWLVSFAPIIDTMRTGQVNLLVFACLSPLFFQPKRPAFQYATGVLLALAIILKVYLLLLLPVLLVLHQKNILLSASATLVLICLASWVLLPGSLWTDWFELGRHGGGYGKPLPDMMTIPWNQSVNGFFIRQYLDEKTLGGMANRQLCIYLACGLMFLSTLGVIAWKIREQNRDMSHAVALTLLTATLIAPLTWQHHFVFALPAAVSCLALSATTRPAASTKLVIALVWLCVILMSYPWLANIFLSGNELKSVNRSITLSGNLVLSAQLLAGFGLWFLFCLLAVRQNTRPASL
jgi:alpha-1,2-mannosyltransferase